MCVHVRERRAMWSVAERLVKAARKEVAVLWRWDALGDILGDVLELLRYGTVRVTGDSCSIHG